ncbi:hypothetical protein ACIBHX_03265 [Nonomuraea sp. NPDC050536]
MRKPTAVAAAVLRPAIPAAAQHDPGGRIFRSCLKRSGAWECTGWWRP